MSKGRRGAAGRDAGHDAGHNAELEARLRVGCRWALGHAARRAHVLGSCGRNMLDAGALNLPLPAPRGRALHVDARLRALVRLQPRSGSLTLESQGTVRRAPCSVVATRALPQC